MKRTHCMKLICMVLVTLLLTSFAFADMGPKPSVTVDFTGIEGETYYATLLSARSSTGPASAWDGKKVPDRFAEDPDELAIWNAFVAYADPDGYYYLQQHWDCSETNQMRWGYYPPSQFKILLYFPAQEAYVVTPVYECYAFDSYYTVDLTNYRTAHITAVRSYDFTWELVSLVVRIIMTVLLEIGVAVIFGFHAKKTRRLLLVTNLITQIILNVTLNIVNYQSGSMAFTAYYILLELIVFAIEAVVYARWIPKTTETPCKKWATTVYALLANTVSFAVGLGIAHLIPGIF